MANDPKGPIYAAVGLNVLGVAYFLARSFEEPFFVLVTLALVGLLSKLLHKTFQLEAKWRTAK